MVPLAAVVGLFYVWRVLQATPGERSSIVRQLIVFCAATLPGCLAVALLNNSLYGSPLSSGYAPFHELYQWKHVPMNLDRYPRWLVETQTPLVYLGVLTPYLVRDRARAWFLLGFVVIVIASFTRMRFGALGSVPE